MFHFILGLSLIFNLIWAETPTPQAEARPPKITQMDELKAPNVYMSDTRFIFEGLIISLFNNKNHSYLAFDLSIDREDTPQSKQHEDDIPVVIDTLISDLTPSLELFWNGSIEGMQDVLTKRITRVLQPKFKWIKGINVSNVRVQISKQPPYDS